MIMGLCFLNIALRLRLKEFLLALVDGFFGILRFGMDARFLLVFADLWRVGRRGLEWGPGITSGFRLI